MDDSLLQSPFCQQLRSKKFFLRAVPAVEAGDYLDGSGHCWCYETQLPVGPDGGKVEPARCVPGRSCYKSSL